MAADSTQTAIFRGTTNTENRAACTKQRHTQTRTAHACFSASTSTLTQHRNPNHAKKLRFNALFSAQHAHPALARNKHTATTILHAHTCQQHQQTTSRHAARKKPKSGAKVQLREASQKSERSTMWSFLLHSSFGGGGSAVVCLG